MESLEILANNIANATTAGFKADREFYSLYTSGDGMTASPDITRNWVDYSQGALQHSGKPTDLALSGQGFFVVEGGSGPLYTRAGNFRLSPAGVLESSEGQPVLDTLNRRIQVQPNAEFQINATGGVFQNGQQVAQLQIVDFTQPQLLKKAGHSTFVSNADPKGPDGPKPAAAQVYQGYTEAPNVQAAESAVRMIHVLRQFESLQKAMTMAGEMNRRVLDEVARVNG